MSKTVVGAGVRYDEDDLAYNPPPGANTLKVGTQPPLAERARQAILSPAVLPGGGRQDDGDDEDEEDYDDEGDDGQEADVIPQRRPRREPKPKHRAAAVRPKGQRSTKMLSGAGIDVVAIFLGRTSIWLILTLGFIGSALAAHGGANAAAPLIPPFSWENWGFLRPLLFFVNLTSIIGLSVQLGLTLIQWKFRNNKLTVWWIGSIVIDAGLTYVGYRDVLVLMFVIAGIGIAMAHFLSVALSLLGAILPEPFLIRD